MNPMTSEMYEGYGDANSLLLIIGWFIYVMAAYGVAHLLQLSHKNSLRFWALCNAAPIIILLIYGRFSLPAFLGLSVMAGFSYAMGSAVFDNREKERQMKQKFLEEESRDING